MRFPTISRQKKTFKVAHTEPGVLHLDYIVLPVGYSYNSDIANAKKGDTIRFADGTSHRIFSVRRLPATQFAADLLCLIRYGITIKGAMERWRMNAKMEGHGENAVSRDECLWVIYEIDE